MARRSNLWDAIPFLFHAAREEDGKGAASRPKKREAQQADDALPTHFASSKAEASGEGEADTFNDCCQRQEDEGGESVTVHEEEGATERHEEAEGGCAAACWCLDALCAGAERVHLVESEEEKWQQRNRCGGADQRCLLLHQLDIQCSR